MSYYNAVHAVEPIWYRAIHGRAGMSWIQDAKEQIEWDQERRENNRILTEQIRKTTLTSAPIAFQELIEQIERGATRSKMPLSPVEETNNPNVTTVRCGSPGTDEELVAAAKSGDELAFEMLIKRYQSRIFSVARRYTRVREDAEDIVQQTLQKVFMYLHKFQGKSSFSTWLTRIAINESLMFLRRGRAAREISIDDPRSEDTSSRELEILDSNPNPEMSHRAR